MLTLIHAFGTLRPGLKRIAPAKFCRKTTGHWSKVRLYAITPLLCCLIWEPLPSSALRALNIHYSYCDTSDKKDNNKAINCRHTGKCRNASWGGYTFPVTPLCGLIRFRYNDRIWRKVEEAHCKSAHMQARKYRKYWNRRSATPPSGLH